MVGGGLSLFGCPRSLDQHQCERRVSRLFVRAALAKVKPATPTERLGRSLMPLRFGSLSPSHARANILGTVSIIRGFIGHEKR